MWCVLVQQKKPGLLLGIKGTDTMPHGGHFSLSFVPCTEGQPKRQKGTTVLVWHAGNKGAHWTTDAEWRTARPTGRVGAYACSNIACWLLPFSTCACAVTVQLRVCLCQSYTGMMADRKTDRQTDRQTDGQTSGCVISGQPSIQRTYESQATASRTLVCLKDLPTNILQA